MRLLSYFRHATERFGHLAKRKITPQKVYFLYQNQYTRSMKPIKFLGNSLSCLRGFPEKSRQAAGYELDKVQRGKQPTDFKSLSTLGKGVEEIRIWDDTGTYRVVYAVKMSDAIYVLHAFQKKSEATSKRDVDLIKK